MSLCYNTYMNWRLKMKKNYPPYTITDKMLNLATNIMEKMGLKLLMKQLMA